jgi:hypothetical protein
MTTKYTVRMPSADELYALELQARRMRSQAVAAAFSNAVKAVRAYFARRASRSSTRTMRHA